MEFLKLRVFFLVVLSLLLCTGCGPHQVKSQPPFVSIAALAISGQALSARFDIRNINDVAMTIDAIDLEIRSTEVELTSLAQALKLTIDPNATEEVAIDNLPGEQAGPLLAELESGSMASLAFSLEGRIHTLEDGYLPFRHEGYLYPVPGKPGQFRSASSRSREQR